MMDKLKEFIFEHWWKLLAAVGAFICVTAVTIQHVPFFLIGLGLLCSGVAEWVQHSLQAEVIPGMRVMTRFSYRRNATPIGMLGDLIGIALIAYGLYRLISA